MKVPLSKMQCKIGRPRRRSYETKGECVKMRKQVGLCMWAFLLVVFLAVSPVEAGYVSVMRTITYPTAESGAEIVSSILSNAEPLTVADTGGTSEGYEQMANAKIEKQLNLVTFSGYRNVGDMPITRAILGMVNFNLTLWPEVATALADKVPSSEFNKAKIRANKLMDGPIPRAQAVVKHAQEILPGVMYPIAMTNSS